MSSDFIFGAAAGAFIELIVVMFVAVIAFGEKGRRDGD